VALTNVGAKFEYNYSAAAEALTKKENAYAYEMFADCAAPNMEDSNIIKSTKHARE
jgi:hypothetical protein